MPQVSGTPFALNSIAAVPNREGDSIVTSTTEHSLDKLDTEDGFGMIEIIVSMFMLALLAIAFLPVLIQGLKASDANARLATATQLVNQGIEQARNAQFADCVQLQAFASTGTASDGRGGSLTVTTQVACDAAQADPERVVVFVTPTLEPSRELARATTFVTLGG